MNSGETQIQPQTNIFPSCTGQNSSTTNPSSSSASSSSSSFSHGHSSIEQAGINQSTIINNQAPPSTFLNQNSAMNSTFNSSMSSLDRGSPTLGNQNLNHNNNVVFNTADYLAQLLKDRKQLSAFPNVFHHVERLIDDGMFNLDYFVVCPLLECLVKCEMFYSSADKSHRYDWSWSASFSFRCMWFIPLPCLLSRLIKKESESKVVIVRP